MEAFNKKLTWCRENTPDAVKNLSDAEVLDLMSSSYDRFCNHDSRTFEEVPQ